MLLLATALSRLPSSWCPVRPILTRGCIRGEAGQTAVKPPRLAGVATVDGVLDEPMWRAGRGADRLLAVHAGRWRGGERLDRGAGLVLGHGAAHRGSGLRAAAGTVRSTLAERDRIGSDDQVQLYLSTFNDGRQASYFAVNPLGVQADGALNESGGVSCGNGVRRLDAAVAPICRRTLSGQSKGPAHPDGYVVEMRIPFKSIRIQREQTQTWGINVLRVVQRSGQEQTLDAGQARVVVVPGAVGSARRADRSRQAGHVLDIVPTLTSRVTGAPPSGSGRFEYGGGTPGDRRRPPLRRHPQPDAARHGTSRLLAGRERRHAVRLRPAAGRALSPSGGRSSSTASSSSMRRPD